VNVNYRFRASFIIPITKPCLGSPPPNGSFFILDDKEANNQGCTKLAKNQIFGLEIKELAASRGRRVLKQLLCLAILQIDFLNANSLRLLLGA